MKTLPGYTIVAEVRDGSKTVVYRGYRTQDARPVILKLHKADYPDVGDLARLRHEYAITRDLELDGIVRPYALEQHGHALVLVMEDFGGVTLRTLLLNGRVALDTFLPIAISLADTLGRLHQLGIIHKDIKPGNILINPTTGAVKLADFGIAARLPRENQAGASPPLLEGTLAYISPEQTGRMNRAPDYRSDLYSLGVTLYELLTGQVPFPMTDPAELVHAHIAKSPLPPIMLFPDIPPVLSAIVLKLLAKTAEARYQSAYGLKADLETCLAAWQTEGTIADFIPGRHDRSDSFQIPQKLYGREAELATLADMFAQVHRGTTALLLVSGSAGAGKSTLVQEIQKPVLQTGGYVIAGKFDQMQRTLPYSAIIRALQALVRHLLTESEAQLARWRDRLLAALGTSGQVITDVVPEVELIIGPQPPVAELPPAEAQHRFTFVFQNFIRVFAQIDHPLVLFLDDLHWADAASLKLIEQLLADRETHALLLIGAYRDNELTATHPLTATLAAIRVPGVLVEQIHLTALDQAGVTHLIADTLGTPPEAVAPLAALVYGKTGGNPFFLKTFLRALHAEQVIWFDPTQGWRWELAAIQQFHATANVVDLMVRRLERLALPVQAVLRRAACIGNQFDLSTLATLAGQPEAATETLLLEALQEQLIIAVGPTYAFAHDRIQEAAASLVPAQEQAAMHYQIGRLRLQQTDPGELSEQIFEIVDHLNLGAALVATPEERLHLAQLNLIAGQRARSAAAFEAALTYLTQGMQLSGPASWQTEYELALALHVAAAEAAYMCADFTRSEELVQTVLAHAQSLLDRVQVYELLMHAYISRNRMVRAVDIGLEVLDLLGVQLVTDRDDSGVQLPGIDDLARMPTMTQTEHLAAMRILVALAPAAIQTRAKIYPQGIRTQIRYCLEHGHASWSAVSYGLFGFVLISGPQEDIVRGYHAGQLALRLLAQFDARELQSKVFFLVNAHIRHWQAHVAETIAPLKAGVQSGLEHGDLQFVGYNAKDLCAHRFFLGAPLAEVAQEQTHYIDLLSGLKQEHSTCYIQIWHQVVLNLLGQGHSREHLAGPSFAVDTMLPYLEETNNRNLLFHTRLAETMLAYLFGQYAQAVQAAEEAEVHSASAPGLMSVGLHRVYQSLAMLANYSNVPPATQAIYLDRIAQNQQRIRRWAPANYGHLADLIEAELARVRGQTERAMDCYDRAIAGALEQRFTQISAMAYEQAAAFYLALGRTKIAQIYLKDAHYCYTIWGAAAKCWHLEARYPDLLDRRVAALSPRDPQTRTQTGDSTSTSSTGSAVLDLATVLKASQTLVSAVELDLLLERLMGMVLENAGAQKGLLILEKEGELLVQAEGTVDQPTITVLQSRPVDTCTHLSTAIVNYVRRTGTSMVVADAAQDERFVSDPYVVQHAPRSILCLPILNQGRFVGLLYLENNLTSNAFTPERLEVMRVLAAQAAIALDNARLYAEMRREIAERQRAEEALRSITEGTASVTGGDFFRSLIHHLAAAFAVRYAFVAECTDPSHMRARTIAFLENGQFLDNIEYDLAGTPCEQVVAGDVCYYPMRLEDFFPAEAGLQSYLGAPIHNSAGQILGHLAVLDPQPMERTSYDMAMLRIFAARAGTELERQRAEEALRTNEARYRKFYNKTPAMLHSIDSSGNLISVSDYWLQMFGYERDEVIGRRSIDFLTEASRTYAQEVISQEFFQQGGVKDVELEFVTKSGAVIQVLLSSIAEKDAAGQFTRSMSVLTDITRRKQAEDALRQSEGQLRRLNEQLSDYSRNLEQRVAERTQEIERRRHVAERTRDMLAILNSNRPLDEILDYIVAEGIKLLGTQSGAVYRLDADQGIFIVQAARGLPPDYIDGLTFPMDQSFLGRALRTHQPVVVTDLMTAVVQENIGISEYRRALLAENYHTLLAVPLMRQGDTSETEAIYGGIALYYPEPRSFTEEELGLVVAFADQATLAIENADLRQRLQQAAIMEERARLSRELHDSVTQSLYSLTLLSEGWRRMAAAGRLENVTDSLAELGSIGQQALKEMRLLVHQLRPPALEKEGLLGALHQRLGAVERRAGVEARLIADDLEGLPAALEEGLYRIAQEALNNSLKHASATSVTVHIRNTNGQIELEVVDNGQGFDPDLLNDGGGVGLSSMRERTAALGGTLTMQSAPGAGTCVRVSFAGTTGTNGEETR
jgi:PAS domain S-box-containing protein